MPPHSSRQSRRTSPGAAPQGDAVSTMMSMLLPIHTAATFDWLVDATATAAEHALNSAFTFLYVEEQDGRLERRQPASDLRRRSQQRAIDAFGRVAFATRLDPRDAPAMAGALDAGTQTTAPAAEIFAGLIAESDALAAQKALGVDAVSFVALESAGERIGALLLMHVGKPNVEHTALFARHVAAAAVNLRQAQAAREVGVIDVARSVFDARKIEADLQRELARAARFKRDVSIAVVEATNLGLLRERFGAFLTDRLLQRLGEALAQNARDIDVIGAYKASGYTMILTEAALDGAEIAVRRMLAIAREVAAGDGSVPGLELHLAAGWATAPADGADSAAVFAAAESRMYGPESQVA